MKKRSGYLLLLVTIFLLALPMLLGWFRVQQVRATYDAHVAREGSQTENSKAAAAALADQSDTFTAWAVALLAWIGGVAFAAELRKIPHRARTLLLLPPAGGLLIASTWSGIIFDRRFSYLALNGALGGDVPLMNVLRIQQDLLLWSFLPIGVVTLLFFWYLLLQKEAP